MKNTITTILLIAIVTISALAQNSPYKGGEVIKVNDSLSLECIDIGKKIVGLNIQSTINIRPLHSKSLADIPQPISLQFDASEDTGSEKNIVIQDKLRDMLCNILTPEQYKLFVENSAHVSILIIHIYYNTSDGVVANAYIYLVKDMPVFMELPPQVYGKFIEQIRREIKLVDGKYKSTPYLQGTYHVLLKDVIKRYPELHK